MRKRTRARELALQALYQLDLRGDEVLEDLPHLLAEGTDDPDVRRFAHELVDGTRARRAELDALISAAADNWALHRIAVVERNLLRMAVFELLHLSDIPPKVSINEAVHLAKIYASGQSGAFVNGVLDHILHEHCSTKGESSLPSSGPGRTSEGQDEDQR